jgi:glucose-6-phosphate isomerase
VGPLVEAIAATLEPLRADVLAAPGPAVPDRLLADYNRAGDASAAGGRAASELFAILRGARQVREAVDRVIVAGGGAAAVRAICAACCHPLHNELSRGDRGGRPRLSFAPPHIDNDSLQALLDLVAAPGAPRGSDLLDAWGIVAVDDGAAAAAPAAVVGVLLPPLLAAAAGRPLADRCVAVAPAGTLVAELTAGIRGPGGFEVAPGIGGFAVFAAPGLLPAAIAGVDVVRLLSGARAMLRRFAEAPAGENPVLRFVAAGIAARRELGRAAGGLVAWAEPLRETCRWYDLVRPRPQGPQGEFATAVLAGEPRRDPLRVPAAGGGAGTPWPQWHAALVARDRGDAAAAILLPRVDELAIGQLLMMLLLAAAVAEKGPRERV